MEFNATFLVAFFSFIVFTVIMNLILYKPINNIVLKRKQLVDANYEEAHENSDKAVSILLDKEKQIKKATDDAKEIIAKCVEKHDNVVRLNEIEFDLAQAGLNYPPRTLRSYITAICVPCNTDANLFCHKNHIDEHPEYSWRKVSNYGQENGSPVKPCVYPKIIDSL